MTTNKERARILLADDHVLFRSGLSSLINEQPDLEVVGQAADGLEALQLARDLQPDLIIMDVNMPISSGLEATRQILKMRPETRILVLTIRDEDETLFEAVKAGARGYMLKNADASVFLEGIRQLLAGEAVLPAKLATNLLVEFARLSNQLGAPSDDSQDFGLTPRETEILHLVANSMTDREIAQKLTLSVYTVKSHVRSILSKLHAANRWEAARRARSEGLLD